MTVLPYLEPNQKSMVELFCKNSSRLLAANFFLQKSPTINASLYCLLRKKKKKLTYIILHVFTLFSFINCSAFVDVKQTLHYKLAIE